jgi:hypothetical protein
MMRRLAEFSLAAAVGAVALAIGFNRPLVLTQAEVDQRLESYSQQSEIATCIRDKVEKAVTHVVRPLSFSTQDRTKAGVVTSAQFNDIAKECTKQTALKVGTAAVRSNRPTI